MSTQARIRPSERGLTLIELMIALLVASLMIGLVFSITTRMSVAYRSQSDVSELQQTLRAAKMRMVQDVRAAGHLIPDGFQVESGGSIVTRWPLEVTDDILPADLGFNSDLIRVFHADASAMAAVTSWDTSTNEVLVDDLDEFALGDLVVVVNPRQLTGTSPNVAAIMHYDACLLQITNLIAPNKIDINQGTSVFNSPTNSHCNDALDVDTVTRGSRPMVYRMAGRAYRIDPDPTPGRRAAGILQMSPSGGLVADDWQDIGIGFTDLQVSVRHADGTWYTTDPRPDPAVSPPLEVYLSLVLRTTHDVDLVPTAKTPALAAPVSDVGEFDLASNPDSARPLQLRGNHVYRWFTARIDLRNLGVGK